MKATNCMSSVDTTRGDLYLALCERRARFQFCDLRKRLPELFTRPVCVFFPANVQVPHEVRAWDNVVRARLARHGIAYKAEPKVDSLDRMMERYACGLPGVN